MSKRPPRSRSASGRRAKPAPAPDRILSAALAAFAERGFDGATTREIAAAAGVPQGLITYHYESKQALWEAAVDSVFAELAGDLGGVLAALGDVDPVARWRALTKRFARFTARRPELHCLMTHEGAHDGPRLRYLVDRHLRPLFEASTSLIGEAMPGIDGARALRADRRRRPSLRGGTRVRAHHRARPAHARDDRGACKRDRRLAARRRARPRGCAEHAARRRKAPRMKARKAL